MAMALVPAVLTLNVSPCSFSVAVDTYVMPGPCRRGTGNSALQGRVVHGTRKEHWQAWFVTTLYIAEA